MLPKLLHLASDTFKGGAESVFRNTIEATLESKQFNIYVASCDETPPCNIDESRFLRLDDWQLYPKWRGAYKYIFNPTNYKRLKTFLFTIKPDIIHTQNYLSRLSPSVLFALQAYKAKHPKVKLIYTQHGFGPCANGGLYNYATKQICEQCIGHSKGLRIAYENCDRRGRIHSILKALRSPFYQGAFLQEKELFDTIICVGEFQRSKHIQDGWDSSKLITLTNPIETRFYNPQVSLEDKQDLLVFFGRLSPEKNIPLLLHAFAKLRTIPRFSHYKLLIIGDGDDKERCLELARELMPQASPNAKNLESTFANTPALSSRDLQQQVVAIHNPQNAKVDSTFETMDCHANASALARNDGKTQNLNESIKDSRSFTQNAQNLSKQQAEAVEMRNRSSATPLSPRAPLPYTFLPPHTPKELVAILAKAKLTILPSLWYETFGLTIVESILAGAIPIASELGAMQETIASFYGKSFSFDPLQALQDSNIQSLEVCIINTLDSYESEFATLLQKREEILRDLHSPSYLQKLIKLYFYGGGA